MSNYSIRKVVDLSYEEAVERVKEELKKEGFGVLTEIDVKATLKKKIDKEYKKYVILGACNPNFAYQALQLEEELGLLLPCNVIVYEKDSGETAVAAIDPRKALTISGNKGLDSVADQVGSHIERVIENI
jgi:uncharacterized protein (DUF302 family)